MNYDYIALAPSFVEELLEVYEKWNGRDKLPVKLKELMYVLEVELSKCQKLNARPGKFSNSSQKHVYVDII